jgi:UDP-glucuronate 4-epimerase
MRRDFTYVDDVIESLVRLIKLPPEAGAQSTESAPKTAAAPAARIYNVGNAHPVEIGELVNLLEKIIGRPAKRELLPMRSIDVLETFADSSDLERVASFAPRTAIEHGLRSFVTWFEKYRQAAF